MPSQAWIVIITLSSSLALGYSPNESLGRPIFDASSAWSIGCFRYCRGLVCGDLDQDGNIDVFGVYNFHGDRISFNEGDGTKTCVSLFHYDERPGSTALADYDRDGDLDVFVAGIEDGVMKIFWYINNGGRVFDYDPGLEHPAYGLALGDLNGDLYPDIVAGGRGGWSDSAIYFNNQQGGFTWAQDIAIDTEPWTIELADVDGDGDLDCAIMGELWLNDGTGHLANFGQTLHVGETHRTWGREFVDVDNDSDLDLLMAESDYGSYVLLNDGNGVFTWTGERLATAINVGWADLNGDNEVDVMTTLDDEAHVYLGSGSGLFGSAVQTIPLVAEGFARDLALLDLDSDGWTDAVLLDGSGGNPDWPYAFMNMGLGDLNCDGVIDIANDLPLFVEALLNPDGYLPPAGCRIDRADMNGDAAYNGLDISEFVSALIR